MFEGLRRQFVYWYEYRRVLKELSNLTKRDLDDIGISFCDIRFIAADAAHKKMLGY